jgi:hypothetical protein
VPFPSPRLDANAFKWPANFAGDHSGLTAAAKLAALRVFLQRPALFQAHNWSR